MKSRITHILGSFSFHIGLIVAGLGLDQLTKWWAVSRLSPSLDFPQGEVVRVWGDFFRFQLAYNSGAAFSSRPQSILPFLSPTVFFLLISLIAVSVLTWFYLSLKKQDWLSHLGIAMIVCGALGNFVDRMRIGKVVDFIDCDFPDFIMLRWPTFNVADCFVTVGVAVVLLAPLIYKLLKFPLNGTAQKDKKNDAKNNCQ
jgi:signal peptidase II